MYRVVKFMLVGLAAGAAGPALASNDCAATVKVAKSERVAKDSTSWRFTFDVATKCDASTGSFKYTYKIKGKSGKPIEKESPTWTAADKKTATIVDEQNIGPDSEAEAIVIDAKSITSKKL